MIIIKSFYFKTVSYLNYHTNFSPFIYSSVITLIFLSGLSFDAFNKQNFIGEYFSANRLIWLAFILFLAAGLRIEKLKPRWFLLLLLGWLSCNFLNFYFVDGYTRLIIVRFFQALFILCLFYSIQQGKFKLREFCDALTSSWSIFVAIFHEFCRHV